MTDKALAKPYEPTTRERTALDAHKRRSPAPRVKVSDNTLSVDHADEVVGETLLMEAIGTTDQDGG